MPTQHVVDQRLCHALSQAELGHRWGAARRAMREQGIDALVVGGANQWASGYFRWFTGEPIETGNARSVLFATDGAMTLVEHGPAGGSNELDGRQPGMRGITRRLTTPSHLFAVSYTGGQYAALIAGEIERAGHRTIGLVGTVGMYQGFWAPLVQSLAHLRVLDATDAIDALKAVKSDEEIALIRATAAMQDDIVEKLASHIRPGLRDFEVAAYAEYLGHLAGSDQGIFLGSSAPQGQPAVLRPRAQQGRSLRDGDVLTLLVENNGRGGYYTEILRSFVLGRAAQEHVDALGVVVEARHNILAHLRPGTPCREVWRAHNAFMRARGLPEERRLNCHSQGYDLVERPLMREDEPMVVAGRMNIACHPGFANERIFAGLCDNFLIGADGEWERLHSTPERLIEL